MQILEEIIWKINFINVNPQKFQAFRKDKEIIIKPEWKGS